jgi:hypothetical protein
MRADKEAQRRDEKYAQKKDPNGTKPAKFIKISLQSER